jgi:uncharacterized protein
MSLSMSKASAAVFLQILKGLDGVLRKASAHAEANKIEPAALLQARLYPDMFPLTRQVQICCDFAKGAAGRLAGDDFPTFEDNETSFEDLQSRVARTIAYIESLEAAAIDGSEDRDIALVRRGETTVHKGEAYLLHQALPNFYFHAVTAYDILRHNGVPVGKRDFLGSA